MVELTANEKILQAQQLEEQGKAVYKEKKFAEAAELFIKAASNTSAKNVLEGEERALRMNLC